MFSFCEDRFINNMFIPPSVSTIIETLHDACFILLSRSVIVFVSLFKKSKKLNPTQTYLAMQHIKK